MPQLFGDPFNLQGNNQNLQGGNGGNLQPAGNPQQVYGPVPAVKPAPAPVRVAPRPAPVARKPAPVRRVAPAPTLDPSGLVGGPYSQYIGARPSPINPGVAEYFRKDTGQALDQQGLFNYASSLGLGQVNSFDQLKGHPNVQAAGAITNGSPAVELAPPDPNQSLAQSAAQAGLSVDDYLKLVSSQFGLSEEEKAAISQGLGIRKLESDVFTPPSKTTEQLYNDAYGAAGLADLKAKIDAKLKEINTIQGKYTDAGNTLNENPFLSEATRVGRLSRLDDKRKAEVGNLETQLQQLQDLYNNGVNEIHNLVSMQTADFSANQQLNASKLNYLLSKAERQTAEAQAKKSAGAYQYLPDYLKAKAKAQKPDTIGSAETGFFRWNPETSTFEQVIAPKAQQDAFSLGFDPISGSPYVLNKNTGSLNGGSAGGTGNGSLGGGYTLNNSPTGLTTPAAKNNNPGNLRDPKTGAWQKFATPQEGFEALKKDLMGKMTGNTRTGLNGNSTLLQFTNVYAPKSDGNNPTAYAQDLAKKLGVTVNTKIGDLLPRIDEFAAFVAQHEDGKYAAAIGLTGKPTQSGSVVDNLVQQVVSNPQLLAQLPEAQQKAVTARMAQLNLTIPTNTKPLTGEALNKKNSLDVLESLANQASTLGEQTGWSGVGGLYKGSISQFLAKNFGKGSQQEQQLRNLVGNIKATLAKERGGTSFTPNEQALLETYTPTIDDSPLVLKSKLASLMSYIRESKTALLGNTGGSQQAQSSSGNDPLGLGI
jgi:hypothetical protein